MLLDLILGALALMASSGLPAALARPGSRGAQRAGAALLALGSALGLAATLVGLARGLAPSLDLPWGPWARFQLGFDALSAVFLLPIFIIPAAGALYGLGYWPHARHPTSGAQLSLVYGLNAAAMGLVVLARSGVLFLMAWELMAVSAYFAIVTEHRDPAVRRAGWIYLIATHLGTLCLVALFALLANATGSGALQAPAPGLLTPALASALFLLALAGFGLKAGLMPLHFWLPGAHANAPSHVSALLSGVMLKMGVYGLLRVAGLLPQPPWWWGGLVLLLGGVSCVLGIAYSLAQGDLKRALAFSSIENIGIIFMGLGLALLGRWAGRPEWVVLGTAGALLHVWNHSLFKPLLFYGAGGVIHAAGDRQMDRLGGLAGRMPWTAAAFFVGSAALCGLPPLNGFVSEFVLSLGLFQTLRTAPGSLVALAAVAAVALAFAGALALAGFVKVYGTVFLGAARGEAARRAHEAGAAMLAPMAALALACALMGLGGPYLLPLLLRATAAGVPGMALPAWPALGPLPDPAMLLAVSAGLWALLALAWLGTRRLLAGRPVAAGPTWACAFPQPVARMQLSGSSLADALVGALPGAARAAAPALGAWPPASGRYRVATPDALLDRLLGRGRRLLERLSQGLRLFQHGRMQPYFIYFLAILLILFLV